MLAIALLCASATAQTAPSTSYATVAAAVYLEPHAGQTHFKIGDPILLDLVFAGATAKYVVKTDSSPYLPPADQIEIAPADGWLRTRAISRSRPLNLSAIATLDGDPVRTPVLVNRTITFTKPGHYEITVTTDRLRFAETILKAPPTDEHCATCRTTNAVGIDIAERDPGEESALVASLTPQIESAQAAAPTAALTTPEQQEEERQQREREIAEFQLGAGLSDEDKVRDAALVWKWKEAVRKQAAELESLREMRRDAAIRLACLSGDDAVRAKVHFLATGRSDGDADSLGWIMVNGLTSSGNKQLQFDLLQQAWRDPQNIPTYQLQTALRQARELTHSQTVTDEAVVWAGTPEDHAARTKEYQADLNELIATLPQRSAENRAQTIDFLKSLGVPKQFNGLKASR